MTSAVQPTVRNGQREIFRLVVALLIPVVAFEVQWLCWDAIQPYVWLLFFPAVFFSSWVGGLRGGLLATGIATGLAWYFFIPPRFTFGVDSPLALVSIVVFLGMGFLFSLVHGRLQTTTRQLAAALDAARSANDQLAVQVRQTEDRLHLHSSALESAANGVMITDNHGSIQWINPAFTRLTGYSAEESLGRNPRDLVKSGEHPPAFYQSLWTTILAGRVWRGEIINRRKDGTLFTEFQTITPLRDAQGQIRHFIAIKEDITARKQVEAELHTLNSDLERRVSERASALRVSEDRYHLLFDSIDEGCCIIEMIFDEQEQPVDYRFLEINPSFERQTGLRDAVGKRMRELAPAHEAHWFEIYGRVALTGEPIRFQNHAAQLHRWYDVYAFQFGTPQQRQVAILFNDITTRQLHDAEVIRLNAELAQRSSALEAANKELEAFSYSVSHDLRAPLRSIDGFSHVLVEDYGDKLDDNGKDYLRRIRAAAGRMGQLIDDLLVLARLTRAEMQRQPVDLSALARLIATELQNREPQRSVHWEIADRLIATGDAKLLRIALENLLGNAWKFTRKQPAARIEVGRLNGAPAGDAQSGQTGPVFFVRDNGAGFDMAYVQKLFGAFQRLHGVTEFEGTGIGLATVQRIIHRHGGRIWAEAAVNEGARFYFTLEPN